MSDISYRLFGFNYSIGKSPLFYDFALRVMSSIMHHRYDVYVEGAYKIPKAGPALILPKHQFYDDIPLMAMVVHSGCGRRANTIMKKELLQDWYGVYGLILVKGGGIPINRENTKESIRELRYARELVKNGELMIVYPEGTRNLGVVGKVNIEAIRFWQNTKVDNLPFIPVGIIYDAKKVAIRVGEPIPGQGISAEELTDIITQEISRLSNLPTKQ